MGDPVARFVALSLGIQEAASLDDFETLSQMLDEREATLSALAESGLEPREAESVRRADALVRQAVSRHLAEAVDGRLAYADGQRLHSALKQPASAHFDTTG